VSEKGQIKILFERLKILEKEAKLGALTLRLHLAMLNIAEKRLNELAKKGGDKHEESVY